MSVKRLRTQYNYSKDDFQYEQKQSEEEQKMDRIRQLITARSVKRIKLYPFQEQCVRWGMKREQDPEMRGGLIADEMGLGKTLQSLCICVGNLISGPTLILTPVSTVLQWAKAAQEYFGLEKQVLVLKTSDVTALPSEVVLQYRLIIAPYSALTPRKNACQNVLLSAKFGRVIFDEVHCIKNHKTKVGVCS